METRHTRVIEEIAKLGSISAASETIGYTQSAITKILLRIEDEFGERLFDRHPRGMRLNECGSAFLDHALAIDKEIRDAKSKITALKNGETGHVVLGTAAWSTQILPGILANLAVTRPNLKLRVVESNAIRLEQMLLEGRIDLAFTAISQPLDASVVVERIGEVEFSLVTAIDHPLTKLRIVHLGDAAQYRWILAEGDARTSMFLERQFAKHDLPWSGPDIELLPRHALFEVVASTDLISFIPVLNNSGASPSIAKLSCADLQWRIPAALSYRKNRPVTAAGLAVIEEIKQQFRVAAPRCSKSD